MKHILRFFGLIRIKDINKYLDDEKKYWQRQRKGLTDINDILNENSSNRLSHFVEIIGEIKADINLGNY
jgi:hypothetical protein